MDRAEQMLKQLRIDRSAKAGKPRRRWRWPLAIVSVLAVLWLVLGRSGPVAVETAVARDAASSGPVSVLDATGYVVARRQATVSAKITGKVREVLIEEGMRVAEDQVVARLDDTDAQAQFALSTAQLNAARAQLGEVRANLALAEREVERQKALIARKLVSESVLDQAQTERAALAARLASAQQQVQVSERALAVAQINIDNTIVRAPFAGVVIAKAAQPGEMISPVSAGGGFTRTGICTLVDMDSLEIEVDVNEAYIGRVQPEMPVQAVLNAYPDWKIPAKVIAIIPAADRAKATVKVRIAITERDPRIVPDMGVRVSFLEAPGAGEVLSGVWLPSRAIVENKDAAPAVFVVADSIAIRREVKTGTVADAETLVSNGVTDGEVVVLSPPPALRDGSKVLAKQP
ncbi:MAG: efflux RND transporter periplasmic adaptor subunit [Gammaproteobacteria bacterium HGW-Gammaproteobacteria-2]|jgi:RND family efflux transporter MFP subunit|nr:MAG: efflux RND transporter periplasmic adaptor subunit [Gammaproteobacteria bacterium HGW-Gammaproteobacteria-2]